MKHVGTLAWAASNGRLRNSDRARLLGQALLERTLRLPAALRARIGLSPLVLSRIDTETLRFPDTNACISASALAASVSAPWLFNHCMRTYLWGVMLAQADHIQYDPEQLFVASALHDLGLTDARAEHRDGCHCFAVEGAWRARRFAIDIGWNDERADRLAEAIALHLNVRVALDCGAEAHLLNAGAGLDVIGARIGQLHSTSVDFVLHNHPRLDFKQQMVASIKAEAKAYTDSRAAWLANKGFIRMIRNAPFDEPISSPPPSQ